MLQPIHVKRLCNPPQRFCGRAVLTKQNTNYVSFQSLFSWQNALEISNSSSEQIDIASFIITPRTQRVGTTLTVEIADISDKVNAELHLKLLIVSILTI